MRNSIIIMVKSFVKIHHKFSIFLVMFNVQPKLRDWYTRRSTHPSTHTQIYIHVCVCWCVCGCMCVCVCVCYMGFFLHMMTHIHTHTHTRISWHICTFMCYIYYCSVDLLFECFGISCMTTYNFCFYLQKQTNPNQSNRRSTVQWYFPL